MNRAFIRARLNFHHFMDNGSMTALTDMANLVQTVFDLPATRKNHIR